MNTPHRNTQPANTPDDQRLRQALQAAARQQSPASEALQQRVLAQWRLRHPLATQAQLAGAGGTGQHLGSAGLPRRWLLLAAVTVLLATLAWCSRPDPLIEELMQPDVLSQIAIGEL